ncbi:unnamed protein product [[Candida] boidinii]|nr:unnamed protein product [[Candida] boidinii]
MLLGVKVDEEELILLTAIGSRVLFDCNCDFDCEWSVEPTVFPLIDVKDDDIIGVGVDDCPDNEDEEEEDDDELGFVVGNECGVAEVVGSNGGGLRCNIGDGDEEYEEDGFEEFE